jgi:hypothetical protein
MFAQIKIDYDGLDADGHMLDLRLFGEAAIGLDKLANTGLIAISDFRLPKRGERFPLRVLAQEPREGTFEYFAILAPLAASTLPLVHELFYTVAGEVLWRWLSWVASMMGGRPKEAEPHFKALMDLTKEIHKGRIESEDKQRQFFLDVLDKVQPAARGFVAPVGPSANSVTIGAQNEDGPLLLTHIDVPMADAIRSKEKLEVGDMEKMRVRVDGLIHHNRQLKVELPDQPGRYFTANVRDPAFSDESNIYMDAVASQGYLDVSAKPSRKQDGTLQALYILDASAASEIEP